MRAFEPAAVRVHLRALLGWAIVLSIALVAGAGARI